MLAVELRNLTKVFGQVRANDSVNLRVEAGTIHGIVGENGAGKSTAMKMLYGIYSPDSGEILIHGESKRWRTPANAIAAGIGMVHQHFMLAGPYTALDNILLGAEPPFQNPLMRALPKWARPIDRKSARKKLEGLAAHYGLSVPWDRPIEELPVGVQQRVEILKLLYRDARILILDEPTAVLTPQEIKDLFNNLKSLREQGKTVLIITHKLREVMEITDEVTVFRAGKVSGMVKTAETSPAGLAELMVGRKVVLRVEEPEPPVLREPVLELKGVSLDGAARPRLADVNFEIRGGEVVGIAGVEGNGQSELLQAILHPSEPGCRSSGTIRILGKDVTGLPTSAIRRMSFGMIPEDRHKSGLLLDRSVRENFLLGLQRNPKFNGRGGILLLHALERAASEALENYDIRPRSLEIETGRMSGGNQQKVIIAREFEHAPKFLVAAQPTRGVDVGAIEFIHKKILSARRAGAGVLLVSSELDEILSLSDRILVIYEGKIVAEFERGKCTERDLGLYMSGGARK